jgi:hypothetical protein
MQDEGVLLTPAAWLDSYVPETEALARHAELHASLYSWIYPILSF